MNEQRPLSERWRDMSSEEDVHNAIVALEARVAAAETELRRLGYGVEPIFVFGEHGRPSFTSLVGDASWDTVENRRLTFEFIEKVSGALEEAARLRMSRGEE